MTEITWLVDGPALFFRAYYGAPSRWHDNRGEPVDGAVGFARGLAELISQAPVDRLGVAFDFSLGTGFRHALYPLYKHRRPMPDDNIRYQFELCMGWCEALGVAALGSDRYEADDILASWAAQARARGDAVVVHTADKDLAQLLRSERDVWLQVGSGQRFGVADLQAHWGIAPERLHELLALSGDSSDDIPGVPGIGRLTAARLLAGFDSLEALFDSLQRGDVPAVRGGAGLRDKLLAHWQQVLLAQSLTRLCEDVPEAWQSDLAWAAPARGAVADWLVDAGVERAFASVLRRLESRLA